MASVKINRGDSETLAVERWNGRARRDLSGLTWLPIALSCSWLWSRPGLSAFGWS